MKVLWLSNTPCGAVEIIKGGSYFCGWMNSMEDAIRSHSEIELSVAYYSESDDAPFEYRGVRYFPLYIGKPGNALLRIYRRFVFDKSLDRRLDIVLSSVIDSLKPDIIHIHGTERSWGHIFDMNLNIPKAISIQGFLSPYSLKFFAGIPTAYVGKTERIYDRLRGSTFYRQYASMVYNARREREYLAKCKNVFGRTQWDKNVAYAINPDIRYFIVNEIMRKPFFNIERKVIFNPSSTLRIVSTMSDSLYKGFENVLQTAHILKSSGKTDFVWEVIGLSQDSKTVRFAEKYTGIKSSEVNISFRGSMDAEGIADVLIGCDVYVQNSHIENSPNSVCEAMLASLPVIASFAGGTSSIITDRVNGLLVQDGDPYACAGAIISLCDNPSYASELAGNAYETAIAKHTDEAAYNELLKAYTSIISAK